MRVCARGPRSAQQAALHVCGWPTSGVASQEGNPRPLRSDPRFWHPGLGLPTSVCSAFSLDLLYASTLPRPRSPAMKHSLSSPTGPSEEEEEGGLQLLCPAEARG